MKQDAGQSGHIEAAAAQVRALLGQGPAPARQRRPCCTSGAPEELFERLLGAPQQSPDGGKTKVDVSSIIADAVLGHSSHAPAEQAASKDSG